jgi:hypothetical protein
VPKGKLVGRGEIVFLGEASSNNGDNESLARGDLVEHGDVKLTFSGANIDSIGV